MIEMDNLNFLKPVTVKSTVQVVVDQLTQAIIKGKFKPGDKIPTEPELAAMLQVGRNTVREAIRTLIAYGILEIRRPEGTFVCDTFKPQGINPMIYSLILKKEDSYKELVGLRESIEVGIMLTLIDQGISEEQTAYLRQCAQAIEQQVNMKPVNISAICDADINFHDAVAKATNNRLLVSVNDMVAKLSYGSRVKTTEALMQNNPQYLIDTHYDLIDKLIAGDTPAMCAAIKNSYRYWAEITTEPS